MYQTNITMKNLLIALMASISPAFADGKDVETIEFGNFTFKEPLLMSVNYAMSQNNSSVFALAITHSDQAVTKIGLTESTAIHVNCKSGQYSAAFGFNVNNYRNTAETITKSFCDFHKQAYSHSLW